MLKIFEGGLLALLFVYIKKAGIKPAFFLEFYLADL